MRIFFHLRSRSGFSFPALACGGRVPGGIVELLHRLGRVPARNLSLGNEFDRHVAQFDAHFVDFFRVHGSYDLPLGALHLPEPGKHTQKAGLADRIVRYSAGLSGDKDHLVSGKKLGPEDLYRRFERG